MRGAESMTISEPRPKHNHIFQPKKLQILVKEEKFSNISKSKPKPNHIRNLMSFKF